MHPLFILAFATFLCLIGFLVWNYISTKRRQARTGVGGVADPLSGTTDRKIRSGDEMRASLDAANARHDAVSDAGPYDGR